MALNIALKFGTFTLHSSGYLTDVQTFFVFHYGWTWLDTLLMNYFPFPSLIYFALKKVVCHRVVPVRKSQDEYVNTHFIAAASGPITAKETQDQIAAITSGDAGSSSSDTRSLTDIFKPKADSWECRVCLLRNSGDVAKCPACNTGKPGSAAMPSLSEMFKPKAGSWECQGCFVRNNEDVTACPACGTLKPGVKPELVAKDKPSTSFIFGAKTASGPPGKLMIVVLFLAISDFIKMAQ